MAAQRSAPLLVALALASGLAVQAQDLVGCRLVGASLQCIPGVTESAQQQISTFRDQISADLELEGAIQQQINGLQSLVIAGEAIQGGLLQATIQADANAALAPPPVPLVPQEPRNNDVAADRVRPGHDLRARSRRCRSKPDGRGRGQTGRSGEADRFGPGWSRAGALAQH